MTGHNNSIQTQNPSFMTTLQATLDILDDVSGSMPENTYLTLTNNLQLLYNIHTSNSTLNSTSNSTSNANPSITTSNANPSITTPINYTRNDYVSDISYASIRNFDISNISYASIRNFDINNDNNNNNINENIQSRIQSRIQSLNEETNRINYSARTRLILYGNVFNA